MKKSDLILELRETIALLKKERSAEAIGATEAILLLLLHRLDTIDNSLREIAEGVDYATDHWPGDR